MFKKVLILFLSLFAVTGIQSCDSADPVTGPEVDPEPELIGCEAADSYDWDTEKSNKSFFNPYNTNLFKQYKQSI